MGLEEGEGPDHPFVRLKNILGFLLVNYAMQFLNFLFIPVFPKYFVLHKIAFASGENSVFLLIKHDNLAGEKKKRRSIFN